MISTPPEPTHHPTPAPMTVPTPAPVPDGLCASSTRIKPPPPLIGSMVLTTSLAPTTALTPAHTASVRRLQGFLPPLPLAGPGGPTIALSPATMLASSPHGLREAPTRVSPPLPLIGSVPATTSPAPATVFSPALDDFQALLTTNELSV